MKRRRPANHNRNGVGIVMSMLFIGLLIAILVTAQSNKQPDPPHKYSYSADAVTWGKYFAILDSATAFIGTKNVTFDDAVRIRQELQELRTELLKQVQPQYIADSNYYKPKDSTKHK